MSLSQENRALIRILLAAAFADGSKSEAERTAVRRVVASLAGGAVTPADLMPLYEEMLMRPPSLADICRDLPAGPLRHLAYEMAVSICDADGPPNPSETTFLQNLRSELGLNASAASFEREAAALATAAIPAAAANAAASTPPSLDATPPQTAPTSRPIETFRTVDRAQLDRMVLNYAILNGALELLPPSLSTVAILPLQMKMVYRVGKEHGYKLDRGHIRDFIATAGAGMAAQVVEGYARKLLGGLVGKALGGGLVGSIGRGAVSGGTGAAITFAATYAIGQLAIRYYGGGRTFSTAVLKDTYATLLEDGKRLFGLHQRDIQNRAATLTPAEVMNLVREP